MTPHVKHADVILIVPVPEEGDEGAANIGKDSGFGHLDTVCRLEVQHPNARASTPVGPCDQRSVEGRVGRITRNDPGIATLNLPNPDFQGALVELLPDNLPPGKSRRIT